MPVKPALMRRRPFQEAAASAIDQHATAIQGTREFLADLSVRVDRLETDRTALAAEVAMLKGTRGSLSGRLRWLLTGR